MKIHHSSSSVVATATLCNVSRSAAYKALMANGGTNNFRCVNRAIYDLGFSLLPVGPIDVAEEVDFSAHEGLLAVFGRGYELKKYNF